MSNDAESSAAHVVLQLPVDDEDIHLLLSGLAFVAQRTFQALPAADFRRSWVVARRCADLATAIEAKYRPVQHWGNHPFDVGYPDGAAGGEP